MIELRKARCTTCEAQSAGSEGVMQSGRRTSPMDESDGRWKNERLRNLVDLQRGQTTIDHSTAQWSG